MELRELGEFGFLQRMRGWVPPAGVPVGIGDDAAVVRLTEGASLVAAADALVEGVHFRWGWSSPSDVGYKAVAVNVSDLAAMGATPRWMLLTLCAPPSSSVERLRGAYEGVAEACGEYGVELIGGDTVSAERLVLAVTALGEVTGDPLRRSGAKPGDILAVTGPLGRAGTGVNLLLSQNPAGLSPEDALACMDAHRRPRALVAEGRALRGAGVHAAIDISDGLASDARRLAEASGVGAEVRIEDVPVAEEARRVAWARGWDLDRIALGGGEDYELLVALPEAHLDEAPVRLIEVGRIVPGDGVTFLRGGQPVDVEGWDHFI